METTSSFSITHNTPRRDHTSGFDDAQAIADKVNASIMAQGIDTSEGAQDELNSIASQEIQKLYGLRVDSIEIEIEVED